jgi:hypothetical protein
METDLVDSTCCCDSFPEPVPGLPERQVTATAGRFEDQRVGAAIGDFGRQQNAQSMLRTRGNTAVESASSGSERSFWLLSNSDSSGGECWCADGVQYRPLPVDIHQSITRNLVTGTHRRNGNAFRCTNNRTRCYPNISNGAGTTSRAALVDR